MNPSSERSPPVFASSSAGRRILHKFASPFGQKSRSITEFSVKALDPHKQYSPGEAVKGAVVVKVVKPVRLTHISVCLHGFAQVHKTPGSPAESARGYSSRIGRTQGKKSGEYFGNGFASLFEDESVLCGEGRLAEGSYRFDFEVTFPKDIELPSSIEFERGTISYMITATLTRPTTMNPTISHDQRLFLCERIDIANLLPPKPRTITLEPVSRRSRSRAPPKKPAPDSQGNPAAATTATSSQSAGTQDSLPSTQLNTVISQDSPQPPRTPSLSEASLDSRVSSSVGRISASGSGYQSQRTSDSLKGSSAVALAADRTITATVESLRGGCLRGDSLPISIVVNHTKHIKSMNGVIITLYRLARVDMHPALPLGPMSDGQKRKYEDYYPKSLTGLGGLSLSGAGSSHVFRKDLAQTLVPMIVDPQTLRSEINARVRVPEDAFPTINTVPGSMISFRYYIEVVLDIQGKLAGNDKYFSQRPATNTYRGADSSPSGDLNAMLAIQGPGVLDTAPIRRDKSVVTSVFEVVVGTLDSERKKGKARAQTPPDENIIDTSFLAQAATPGEATPLPYNSPRHGPDPGHYPDAYHWNPNTEADWPVQSDGYEPGHYDDYFDEHGDYHHYDYESFDPPPHFVAPPPMESEEGISEKERLRRLEARLMPSQPPIAGHDVENVAVSPSAPLLLQDQYGLGPAGVLPDHQRPPASAPGTHFPLHAHATPEDRRPPSQSDVEHAPAGSDMFESGFETDDKQELQRRQLQFTASAPPSNGMMEDDGATIEGAAPPVPQLRLYPDEVPESAELDRSLKDRRHLPQYYR